MARLMQTSPTNSWTTHNGRFLHLRETPHGNLDLVLSQQGRECFPSIDSIRNRYGNHSALTILLADHLACGWELLLRCELDVPALGPILARDVKRDSWGSVVTAGRVFWYPDFAFCDEIDELQRSGFLELRGSP